MSGIPVQLKQEYITAMLVIRNDKLYVTAMRAITNAHNKDY